MSTSHGGASSTQHGGSGLAAFYLFVGVITLALWFVATSFQIRTSEAFFLGIASVSLVPDWSIFNQPVQIVQGTLPPSMMISSMCAWAIEAALLIFTVGHEAAHERVRHVSPHLAKWFRTGIIVIVIFDGYTDYRYAAFSSLVQQLLFTLIMAFIVFFFGIAGSRLIELAFAEFAGR